MTHRSPSLGSLPPLGEVPRTMLAWCVRRERYGEPTTAMQIEEVPVPSDLGPREVLVCVMAAGANYNVAWASRGAPLDSVRIAKRWTPTRPVDYFIPGSEASGIVWSVGSEVCNVQVGDRVTVHGNRWLPTDPHVLAGRDPCLAPSFHVGGYEANFGTLAQFTRIYDHQCIPAPRGRSWVEASCFTVSGGTSQRMLFHWEPHVVRPNDPVLIWGGAGGIGSMAVQLCREVGARPIAVVSNAERAEYCMRLGAVGTLDRREFDHWGGLAEHRTPEARGRWQKGAKRFLDAFYAALGERRRPTVVFEHPGRNTLPTSVFVAERGGMVVGCGATTGYICDVDLRYVWVRQKRLQGSHGASVEDNLAVARLIEAGRLDPCVSQVFSFEQAAVCHQLMADNRHPPGNMAVLVHAQGPDDA